MNKVNIAKKLISELYFDSKYAFDYLIRDDENTHEHRYNMLSKEYLNDRREIVAAIFLNKAISSYSSLKAFYYSNYDDLEDYRVENIFESFSLFSDEFLTSVSTKHSHQHTSIYFDEFVKNIESLIQIEV